MAAAVNDIYRVTVGCQWGVQAGVNVTHWFVSAIGGASVNDSDIAAHFDATFAVLYKPLIHNNSRYEGVKVQKIRPLPVSLAAISTANAGVGTGGAAALPPQVAGLISLRTAFSGRAFRGRIYLPFPGEGDNIDATGRPEVLYVNTATTLGTALVTPQVVTAGANTATLRCGIYRRSNFTINTVQAAIVRSLWATQRRRGDFGQPNPLGPL